jgi:cell wall-associated NlpC family hydrolase
VTSTSLVAGPCRSHTGSYRSRRWSTSLLLLAAVALAAAVPALGTGPVDEKKAEARQVYAEIISLDQSLGVADEKINLANLRLRQVQEQQKVNGRELVVARRNLKRSQDLVVKRLTSLYTTSQTTTLDLILGSTSVTNLLTRLDNADRISKLDGQVIGQVTHFKLSVERHARALRHEHRLARQLVAQREAERRWVADKLNERERLLSSIKDQISTLEAQERARQQRALLAAQARIAAAQEAQAQQAQATVVGATVATPEGATVAPSSPYGGNVVSIAMSYLGVPYVWGGSTPDGFDCSGLVMYAFAQLGISLPHSSYAQFNYGTPVSYSDLQPGDLVFFDALGHVGIYIGGGQFVNAPHTGAVVRVDSMTSGWAIANFSGARRIT